MRAVPSGRRRRAVLALTAAAGVTAGVAVLAPTAGNASSHREAPFIASQPQLDNTDVYAFSSPDDASSVTLVANWIPFEEPNGGPNFYPWATNAHYDVNIDNNGDAKPDLKYRWTFYSHYKSTKTFLYNTGVVNNLNDKTLNFTQTYDIDVIAADGSTKNVVRGGKVAPSDVGKASMPNYAALRQQAVTSATVKGGGQSYAGQADDPFFLDLRVFDLLYGGNLSETKQDTLAGYNVNTVALKLPKAALALGGNATDNPVIGVWSDTERPTVNVVGGTNSAGGVQGSSGGYAQVSRLGNPLVNEVVIPVGDKDRFNASTPDKDTQFLPYVQKPEVPRLIQSIYGITAPATPRKDLTEVFLTGICKTCGPVGAALGNLNSQLLNKGVDPATFRPGEMLRLNMAVPVTAAPNRLGALGGDLQGFPNGRRLTDDVVDIELRALEGALPPYGNGNTLGDGVDVNDKAFSKAFPYVALPHDNAVNVKG